MAITSKELAERYFQQAVNLEKVERKKRVQNFDKIFKLYEEVIQADPDHSGALNNLACLHLERKSDNLDEIEKDRAAAKGYYDRAIQHGQTKADHNLRLLNLVNISEQIKDFEYEGRAAEDGRHNRGKLNPSVAISMYKQAEAHYDKYILLLEAEYTRIQAIKPTTPSVQFGLYKRMIAYNKQFAEKGREKLSEKTKETIDQNKENDPNGIFTQIPAAATQKTMRQGSVVSTLNVLFPIQRPLEESLKEKTMLPSIVNSVRAAN